MNKAKKILFVSMKHDYGDPARGLSYDYKNLFLSLQGLNFEVELFDYIHEMDRVGREQMNANLLQKIKNGNYVYTFISFFTDQLQFDYVEQFKKYTISIGIFYDDTWRREFTMTWAKVLHYFTTTDFFGEEFYSDLGIRNAIMMGYGFSEMSYSHNDLLKKYDVSFVGAANATRRWYVEQVRRAGIQVATFGFGWPNGPVSQEELVNIFNQSKINLNLSNSVCTDIRFVLSGFRPLMNYLRSKKSGEQLKGRHVEISACGGFQLSFYADGIETLYQPNKEIAVYLSVDDLINKIKFYLKHEGARQKIAQAGYQKTIEKFEYKKRLNDLFERIRVSNG